MEGSHGELPDRLRVELEKLAASNKYRDEADAIVNVILSVITFTVI